MIFLFGALGYLLHFMGSWSEYCRTQKPVSVLTYIRQDLAGWATATIGAATVVFLAQDIVRSLPTANISPHLLATLLGYTGSSALGKLASMLGFATGDR